MMKRELKVDPTEETNGGMYQGYGGVEKGGFMSKTPKGRLTERGPGMMMKASSLYDHEYVPVPEPQPERKVPPYGGMGTGFMGPGINNYYIG